MCIYIIYKNVISFCCFFLLYPEVSRHRKHRILSVKAMCMKKVLIREITFKSNGLLMRSGAGRLVQCFAGPQKAQDWPGGQICSTVRQLHNSLRKQSGRGLWFLGDGDKKLLLNNVQLSHFFSEIYQMYQTTTETLFSSETTVMREIYMAFILKATVFFAG